MAGTKAKSKIKPKPKAKKPKAPKKPAITKKHYEEHYEQIRAKERDVRELEMEADLAKAESSRRKKEFEEADLELRNLIARGPDLQAKLPFDGNGTAESAAVLASNATADAWKKSSVAELGLPPKLQETLGLDTIGELESLRAEISTGKAKWPKGIGEAKVTLIEDAVIDWLTKNRDKMGEATQQDATLAEANGTRQEQLLPSNGDGQEGLRQEVAQAFDDAGILAK